MKSREEKLNDIGASVLTSAWCLRTPFGNLVPGTLSENKRTAQGRAFDHLYARYPEGWPRNYWHKWDQFIRARKRRGWYVVQVKLVEFGDAKA